LSIRLATGAEIGWEVSIIVFRKKYIFKIF